MIVLGLNVYHGDSSASLFMDGNLVAAVEEERFNRTKHWAGFPVESIRFCLDHVGLSLKDVDAFGVNRDPNRHLGRKICHVLRYLPDFSTLADRVSNRRRMIDLTSDFRQYFGDFSPGNENFFHVEHHESHLASAFFVSPYDSAAILSLDGFGDFSSTALAIGEGSDIKVLKRIFFPHSLGIFYTAITQFLGFPRYGDEYKMMGLAAYGEADLTDKLGKTLNLQITSGFKLNLKYFLHHRGKTSISWDNCQPTLGTVYSNELERLLGPARKTGEDITDYHRALAASAQQLYEQAFLKILKELHSLTGHETICLAGGCAFNSLANGKIFEKSPFKRVYIPSSPGDAGGAIGAATWVQHIKRGMPRNFVMDHAYWGPGFQPGEVKSALDKSSTLQLSMTNGEIQLVKMDEEQLIDKTATALTNGAVVGWYQGRSEWGPRALGNRSIFVDPRRTDMKEILNTKIKKRESFRPFAPSILREHVGEYFETDVEVPFMQQVFKVKPSKRDSIPSVTHVDGTGRLQTVTEEQNRPYYRLIKRFHEKTGIPLLLNTSFNENEPIVTRPEEALDCFLRTKMDVLVMGPYFLERVIR